MARLIVLKHHWLAIILAGVTGLIVGLPHILIPKLIAPEKYDPLQFNSDGGSSITMEEVYTYVPEVREILERKFWVTDTQVAEYNGQSTPFVGETGLAWIMAGLAKITGSIQNAFIVADFVFPAVTFLLVYTIVWLFTKNKVVSVTAGTVLVIWPELLVLFPYPDALISSVKSAFDPRDFLFISRNFHPQLSMPAYLGAFLLVLLALERKKLWLSILTGVAVGFLFYTYIFNWTAFILGLSILGFFAVCETFRREVSQTSRYLYLKHLLIIVVTAAVLAVPYFLQVWNFRQSGLAQDFFAKLSLPKRGFFDLVARQWVFVIIFLVLHKVSLYGRKVKPLQILLFLCFWIAPLLLPDLMQNVLGRDLEGKHWVRRIAYPFGIMGLSIMMPQILNKKLVKLICLPLMLLVLTYGLVSQTKMSYKISDAYSQIPEKQELYDWINQNTVPGSVFVSLDWSMAASIPAHTQAFNFSPIGLRTIASPAESMNRYLLAASIYGVKDDDLRQRFETKGEAIPRSFYFFYATIEQPFYMPSDIVEKVEAQYDKVRSDYDQGLLPEYRFDYILIGPEEKSLLNQFNVDDRYGSVFHNKLYEVYQKKY